jgi:hypothetical protein
MYLLLLRPWVFPALDWSNHVRSAISGIWIASLELQERASDQEHAASAASIAFSISVRVDSKHQACGESPHFAIEWTISRSLTAFLEPIYLLYVPIAFSRICAEMM